MICQWKGWKIFQIDFRGQWDLLRKINNRQNAYLVSNRDGQCQITSDHETLLNWQPQKSVFAINSLSTNLGNEKKKGWRLISSTHLHLDFTIIFNQKRHQTAIIHSRLLTPIIYCTVISPSLEILPHLYQRTLFFGLLKFSFCAQ